MSLYLPKERYLAALERIRGLILKGVELRHVDDTTPGDKSTTCTWGLCSEAKEAWPDAQDHLFPKDFEEHGRIAPKYLRSGWLCPVDSRDPKAAKKDLNGCFHTCRIFQAKDYGNGKLPRIGTVIDWYDIRINQMAPKADV